MRFSKHWKELAELWMMNKSNILEGGQLSNAVPENGQNIEGNVEFKMVVSSISKMIHVNGKKLFNFVKFNSKSFVSLPKITAYMRQLNLPPIIWNESHLKIFPLELLGPAIGLLAGPSSCKWKILRWDTTTNSPTTNKCLILDVTKMK